MENYIYHYGVKGMKWGVRRTPAQLGHKVPRRSLSETASIAASKARAGMAKARSIAKSGVDAAREKQNQKAKLSVKNMTTEELQQRINRLNLEKNYRNLLSEQKSAQTSAAQKFVSKQFGNLASKVADKAITKAVEKMFKEKDTTSILDMSKLDKYTDKELEAAKKRKDTTRDLMKNWEKVGNTSMSSFYGKDGYASMVAAGKGAVQEALKKMNEDK